MRHCAVSAESAADTATLIAYFEGSEWKETELHMDGASRAWGTLYYSIREEAHKFFNVKMYISCCDHAELEIDEEKEKSNLITPSAATGLVFHWGMARREGGRWRPCPYGWVTEPERSWDSGNSSWETETENIAPGKFGVSLGIPVAVREQLPILVGVFRTDSMQWIKDKDTNDLNMRLFEGPQSGRQANTKSNGSEEEEQKVKEREEEEEEDLCPPPRPTASILDLSFFKRSGGSLNANSFEGVSSDTIREIAEMEKDSERSLRHRYSNAADLVRNHSESSSGLAAVLVWLRLAASRQLVWNKNFNVKPREIAVEQERAGQAIAHLSTQRKHDFELLRLLMASVGRGGSSEAGQRIRDEILHVQRRNACKGGMMEEWHQKLHNNTSPDDVVICEALLIYIKSGFKIDKYWEHLNKNGVTAERMRSYDRPIHSEPNFRPQQAPGLIKDLEMYLLTLRAVHCGDDLRTGIEHVLGYNRSSMQSNHLKGVGIDEIDEIITPRLRALLTYLQYVLRRWEKSSDGENSVLEIMHVILESRIELYSRSSSLGKVPGERLSHVLLLDISLDSTIRRLAEQSLAEIKESPMHLQLSVTSSLLASIILSSGSNAGLLQCREQFEGLIDEWKCNTEKDEVDETLIQDTRKAIAKCSEELASRANDMMTCMRPTAQEVCRALGLNEEIAEETIEAMVRGGTMAPLSQLVSSMQPHSSRGGLPSWQLVSQGDGSRVTGRVVCADSIGSHVSGFEEPTILVVRGIVHGDEDIPVGTVALFTSSTIDILCHLAVRARTERVLTGICSNVVGEELPIDKLAQWNNRVGTVDIVENGTDITISAANEEDLRRSSRKMQENQFRGLKLTKKKWIGAYAINMHEWDGENAVGAKALNLLHLQRTLSTISKIKVPTGVAVPFGVFEQVLYELLDGDTRSLFNESSDAFVSEGCQKSWETASHIVDNLSIPENFSMNLGLAMQRDTLLKQFFDSRAYSSEKLWKAVKEVWKSKWNPRAINACKKAGLDHSNLSMSVLLQEAIDAKFAFVVHTVHPITKNQNEMYCEAVVGLGETLVGNYPGAAISFTVDKHSGQVNSVGSSPSKEYILTLTERTLICRSDSNCEDLPGFPGAGLFDSVFVDPPSEQRFDYSSLSLDSDTLKDVMKMVAETSIAVERAFDGRPQDIEGVLDADGNIYVVQSRPQIL